MFYNHDDDVDDDDIFKIFIFKKNDKHFTLKGEKMMRYMNASY